MEFSGNKGDRKEKKDHKPFKGRESKKKDSKTNKSKVSGRNSDNDGQKKEKRSLKGEKKEFAGKQKSGNKDFGAKKPYGKPKGKINYKRKKAAPEADDGKIRLNRFIANAGICSRREADRLIEIGEIKVNGEIVTELGTKIDPADTVHYGNELVKGEKKQYVLLNKPKNYITTSDDPRKRRTVMDLVGNACKERIYPVGRLDRQTTGVLLFTNDGELTKKLTHPSSKVNKTYHVILDKNVTKAHLIQLVEGVELDDGTVSADKAVYVEGASKKEIGIELHSGKNRVIRRMMEAMGYQVIKLDRVIFAGLTKKKLERGKWRFLTDKEVAFLKKLPNKK